VKPKQPDVGKSSIHVYLHLACTLIFGALCAPATCAQIAAKLPEVGCAWNSAPEGACPPDLAKIGRLWWMRYRTVLR
jgi:hypothetical protein